MERIIPISDLKAAVDEAYEKFKSEHVGEIDPRLGEVDPKDLGIAVVLPAGTELPTADAQKKIAVATIAKVPMIELLLSQYGVDELIKRSGKCTCCHGPELKPEIGLSPHGIRATSAVQPTGDAVSKWNLLENNMIDLMGSAPELDDTLYKRLTEDNEKVGVIDKIAKAGYYLFDDAGLAVDLWTRQLAMKVTARQLAIMGATIAADGVNPLTGKIVYDGALSQNIVGSLAGHGPHKSNKPWLVATGLPVKTGFGGGIIGVVPGVFGIAAYAPGLSPTGFTLKGAQALKYIVNRLQISVFASAHVKIDKDK